MPPQVPSAGSHTSILTKKRKDHPTSSASSNKPNGRGRDPKRVKIQDARSILAQTSDAALSNGELDLQKFLAAREFEIKALDDGMRRAKGSLTTRAFQQVPRDMRRRTASHNVKRVPKRLQDRAKREMREDNTPTVLASKRRPTSSRGRVRADTARRLGILAEKKNRVKESARTVAAKMEKQKVVGRAPRMKVGILSAPPMPASKFRKRQLQKTWLPTHMYHAKRAKMTEPKQPLWRFAVPLTSTEKSYRPTHRSGGKRGAVCWDMSYMATIGLKGSGLALEKVLRGVGITQDEMWGNRGHKWRSGKRSWNGFLSRAVECGRVQIGPATVIWSVSEFAVQNETRNQTTENLAENLEKATDESAEKVAQERKRSEKPQSRRIIIRMHPAAFLELWDEILRISKMQRPVVHVEDLRFEIGSIELTGPGSTEALLGILHPFHNSTEEGVTSHEQTFKALGGLTNPGSLPPNALLTFSVIDPRLRYPPRKADLPKAEDDEATVSLLQLLANWPADETTMSDSFFDRSKRHMATRLPSQKALNRRKALAVPGKFPERLPTDPPIPVFLYTSRSTSYSTSQGSWTLLAPWKCILPIWYGLMHYPLSSGGNPRFGGLQEIQQLQFEQGKPWFPGDYPGTSSGWGWELDERCRRKAEWDRRPKGKRTEFTSLNLGAGKRGEIGIGWACDFERLVDDKLASLEGEESGTETDRSPGEPLASKETGIPQTPPPFHHFPSSEFLALLANPKREIISKSLVIVRITLFSRGVPLPCARIYRLPSPLVLSEVTPTSDAQLRSIPTNTPVRTLREQWLALAPSSQSLKAPASSRPGKRQPKYKGSSATPLGRRALAQELLQAPPLSYPAAPSADNDLHPPIPDEGDLIGFVTTGNFNLAQGKGTAIGSLVVGKVLEMLNRGGRGKESRMCIVRNAGETVGRLGTWEAV